MQIAAAAGILFEWIVPGRALAYECVEFCAILVGICQVMALADGEDLGQRRRQLQLLGVIACVGADNGIRPKSSQPGKLSTHVS